MKNYCIAWLIPSAASGAHWQPIWSEFLKAFPNTTFYTTCVWKEFDPTAPYAKAVKIVGELKRLFFKKKTDHYGYQSGLMCLPLTIVKYLLDSKPNIIIANAFSIWSILAVGLKAILGYKIIILYEGSTPNSDLKDSKVRSITRKLIAPYVDAFVANNLGAKQYLRDYLKISESKIFYRSYLVPDKTSLLAGLSAYRTIPSRLNNTVFTFIGKLVKRKGLCQLLQACSLLQKQGYHNFSFLIIGESSEQEMWQQQAKELGLEQKIIWMGRCSYGCLGLYLKQTDIFVFPSLEDAWGMVVLEAMTFGRPILCSKQAGASEMVIHGENGYLFDPFEPKQLAELMQRLIEQPKLINQMGQRSQQLIAEHTPVLVKDFFEEVISQLMAVK
ncbi:glycosyltransferase [Pantanalinema rosaneae CENA516]|uniref:glycosyltransferase n=1 Tax=Pantanalinema rosaneae TaxID=1620701 RepID=UPI003D6F467A